MFCDLSFVFSPWIAALEGFKAIGCERVLDSFSTTFQERRDLTLRNLYLVKRKDLCNLDIGKMFSWFVLVRAIHGGGRNRG